MGTSQQFSLRWNNYLSHITCAFDSLRSDEDLVDVTLSCEGKRIRAHKMLLSACSTYFRDLFKENPCQHPVIIFRNVKFEDLAALVDFMYQGEVNVVQDQLASFLTTAELLAVQGLSDGNGKDQGNEQPKEIELPDSPVLPSEPEIQLSNNTHSQKQHSTNTSSVSSPATFFPIEQSTDSPPSTKRRNGSIEKECERDRETERRRVSATAAATVQPIRQPSPDPIEIIPVPSMKLEMPEYMEQEQDASSCSYSDSNQGGSGAAGSGSGTQQNTVRDPLQSMSQLLPHASVATSDSKQEPLSASDIIFAMSRRGRPLHGMYEELGFIPIKIEHKSCAKCLNCGVTLKNTARERLKDHRKVCPRTFAKVDEVLLQSSQESSSWIVC
ncbi:hypothetical protein L9F63_018875 [Diploptera punctata]|uniref:BTB domain-containing protein n=1 Tax=Diploptera punctata TaxID=6984 RepID=A0AAD8EEN8_DIPPU|nr:hypothetical protein L9F63_018875 [Diploptera punctata]